jgi:hypothetical protein
VALGVGDVPPAAGPVVAGAQHGVGVPVVRGGRAEDETGGVRAGTGVSAWTCATDQREPAEIHAIRLAREDAEDLAASTTKVELPAVAPADAASRPHLTLYDSPNRHELHRMGVNRNVAGADASMRMVSIVLYVACVARVPIFWPVAALPLRHARMMICSDSCRVARMEQMAVTGECMGGASGGVHAVLLGPILLAAIPCLQNLIDPIS